MNWNLVTLMLIFAPFFVNAQFTEDFSDGDFTNNPTWNGDVADFVVDASNELKLMAPPVTDEKYLSTPVNVKDTATWEFNIRLDFAPSTSNFARIYLMSDQSDLKNGLNGYYLKVGGESGTTDALEIYRQDGTSSTLVVRGTDGNAATNPDLSVKIVRDNAGNWSIFSDISGGTTYTLEATGNDVTYNEGTFFGLLCKFTSTRNEDFYFDNINISPLFVDVDAPTVTNVSLVSNTQLQVTFSEPLDISTAQTASNYVVNNGIGAASTATLVNPQTVDLTFGSPFTNGTNYDLTINNVQDLAGNAIATTIESFIYFVPQVGDVVINEIFADPSPQLGLPTTEFVELYNTTSFDIDLNNWSFFDGSSKAITSTILPANGYLILTSAANTADYTSYGTVFGLSSLSLTNGGELLKIEDGNGTTIHEVEYDISWYRDNVKDDGGYTLELINPLGIYNTCDTSSNWVASNHVDGGTPGTQNSVFGSNPDTENPLITSTEIINPSLIQLSFNESIENSTITTLTNYIINNGIGSPSSVNIIAKDTIQVNLASPLGAGTIYELDVMDLQDCVGNVLADTTIQLAIPSQATFKEVIFTEIFADPSPQVGLPEEEFLELYNNSNKVISLNNWTLTDATGTQTLGSVLLFPNEYIILCDDSDESLFQPFGKTLALNSFPSLNNSGEYLEIKNDIGQVIDSLTYDSDWYLDDTKDDGGFSLELIELNYAGYDCNTAINWIASNNIDGGTPGTVNSVLGTVQDNDAPQVVTFQLINNTTLQVTFDENVEPTIAGNTTNYVVNNSIGSPTTVTNFGANTLELTFGTTFNQGVFYELTINNIEDCAGNVMQSSAFPFAIPEQADLFDVVINELFADFDPQVNLPQAEFIELYNVSNKVLDLNNWTYEDASSSTTIPSFLLLPNEYVILCHEDDIALYQSYGNVVGLTSFPSLNNSSDELSIRNDLGELIHFVNYSNSWYQDEFKEDGGWTLEMIDPNSPCEAASNWRASENTNGGTPGIVNSVLGTLNDTNFPEISNAFISAANEVTVVFSETVDPSTGTDIFQYSIDNGFGMPTNAVFTNNAFTNVQLTFGMNFATGTVYELSANGIMDCAGNSSLDALTFDLAIADSAMINDIIINEILANPLTGGNDFVELYNKSDKVIDVSKLYIATRDEDEFIDNSNQILTQTRLLFPAEYIAITEDKTNVLENYTTPNPNGVIEIDDLPTLADAEGTVVLLNGIGEIVDEVAYEDDWHFSLLDDENGVSLERTSPNSSSNDASNWHSASSTVGFATPAYKNSHFTEIEPNNTAEIVPEIISPNNDGRDDFAQIQLKDVPSNSLVNINIYNAEGLLIKRLARNEFVFADNIFKWDGTTDDNEKALIGIYVVAIEIFNDSGDVKHSKLPVVVAQ